MCPCSGALCGVRVIPAVDVAAVRVKAACRAWGVGSDGAGGNSGRLRGGWQTTGVVFVADALGQWLVEQLADAGRKKLTELVLGSEQERALRRRPTPRSGPPPRRWAPLAASRPGRSRW